MNKWDNIDTNNLNSLSKVDIFRIVNPHEHERDDNIYGSFEPYIIRMREWGFQSGDNLQRYSRFMSGAR